MIWNCLHIPYCSVVFRISIWVQDLVSFKHVKDNLVIEKKIGIYIVGSMLVRLWYQLFICKWSAP